MITSFGNERKLSGPFLARISLLYHIGRTENFQASEMTVVTIYQPSSLFHTRCLQNPTHWEQCMEAVKIHLSDIWSKLHSFHSLLQKTQKETNHICLWVELKPGTPWGCYENMGFSPARTVWVPSFCNMENNKVKFSSSLKMSCLLLKLVIVICPVWLGDRSCHWTLKALPG